MAIHVPAVLRVVYAQGAILAQGGTTMETSREVALNLFDVQALIRHFEDTYGVTTEQFLKDRDVWTNIPEGELFDWECYIDFQRVLLDHNAAIRQEYLSRVATFGTAERSRRDADASLLAACA